MSQTTTSPHSQAPLVTRAYPSEIELDAKIAAAAASQRLWRKKPLMERIEIGRRFMEEFKAMEAEIPMELSIQMGRPVSQGSGEVRGTLERALFLLETAPSALADVDLRESDKPGLRRYIKREPLGIVLVIAPWNYPFLTMVNSVLPALIAGNAVLLKPSPQTPLSAERLAKAFLLAGLQQDVLTVLHLSPELTERVVRDPRVSFVSFTGSVVGGRAVARAAADAAGFKGVGLELGGKDPAYVRADANLDYAVEQLVDGAIFNSGQSCCAVEVGFDISFRNLDDYIQRIYVHTSLYDQFVLKYVGIVESYRLGNPTHPDITLGPVVSLVSAARIRKQVEEAVKAGARALVSEALFPLAQPGTTYVAPQVLVDVDHSMDIMKEETFGPVVGIMKVSGDAEALTLMNDSAYGLTASIWTEDVVAFEELAQDVEAGTVFMNRCDYLDPALAWTGIKDSGRGVTLSKYGYDQLTRAKSVHVKYKTQ